MKNLLKEKNIKFEPKELENGYSGYILYSKCKIDDIFDSFEQVDRTLSRGAEGTGMGLYLVKKLCELHDIEVYAYSKEQIGSEFKIVINENIYSELSDISNELYNIPQNSEKIDVEYSDIYIDIS